MSLADVLSATRELIFSRYEIPSALAERTTFYRERFPALTPEELEDLAKIDPARLRIYTGTVYAGERNTLRMHFPLTFALLKRAMGDDFDSMELIKDVHERYPWSHHSTKDLAERFARYIANDVPRLVERDPFLPDVARMEVLDLEIARAEDTDGEAVEPAVLGTLTVGDLLELDLVIPVATRTLRASCDVLAVRRAYFAADNEQDFVMPDYERRDTFLVGGRNAANYVRWVEVPESVLALFEELASGTAPSPVGVQLLADAFVSSDRGPDGGNQAEEELFAEFVAMLRSLLERGLLLRGYF